YLGNVGDKKENTYCPNCNKLLIRRSGMETLEYKIRDGRCPHCGREIYIKGEKWIPERLKQL
ncbi:MAG: hypothetical protein KAU03_03400, partial [Candidatus Altiarchaeales archaeon]|nr:hypothetical protein [Candidatus Altiarchaeales archaeon]